MFYMITGGSGSGKSDFAEKLAVAISQNGERYYLATMKVLDDESEKRVKRHRKQREGAGFETIECFQNIHKIELSKKSQHCTILLECMSNLLLNETYGSAKKRAAEEDIIRQVVLLLERCENLIIVTNEVFSDGIRYDRETEKYIENLGKINCTLCGYADAVCEVVYGIPVWLKGEEAVAFSF